MSHLLFLCIMDVYTLLVAALVFSIMVTSSMELRSISKRQSSWFTGVWCQCPTYQTPAELEFRLKWRRKRKNREKKNGWLLFYVFFFLFPVFTLAERTNDLDFLRLRWSKLIERDLVYSQQQKENWFHPQMISYSDCTFIYIYI